MLFAVPFERTFGFAVIRWPRSLTGLARFGSQDQIVVFDRSLVTSFPNRPRPHCGHSAPSAWPSQEFVAAARSASDGEPVTPLAVDLASLPVRLVSSVFNSVEPEYFVGFSGLVLERDFAMTSPALRGQCPVREAEPRRQSVPRRSLGTRVCEFRCASLLRGDT